MVHSQRHSGTGDIVAAGHPAHLVITCWAWRANTMPWRGENGRLFQVRKIAACGNNGLWDNGGGTLTGNWRSFRRCGFGTKRTS